MTATVRTLPACEVCGFTSECMEIHRMLAANAGVNPDELICCEVDDAYMREPKPLHVTAYFEYWQVGEDVFRNPANNRGHLHLTADKTEAIPANARWECGIEHFWRYKDVLA